MPRAVHVSPLQPYLHRPVEIADVGMKNDFKNWSFPKLGYLIGGPHNKDCSTLILGNYQVSINGHRIHEGRV